MRQAALVFAILLAGCSDLPTTWSRSDIQKVAADEADDAVSETRTKTEEQEEEIEDLKTRVAALEQRLGMAEANAAALSDQVSGNAKAANLNAIRDMTRRGACGKEWAVNDYGQSFLTNKRCTEKDLAP